MKTRLPMRMVWLWWLVAIAPCLGATNLMPGLTYYEGPEKLTGKLVFLHNPKAELFIRFGGPPLERMPPVPTVSICVFDLATKQLRRVVECPDGLLYVAPDGETFCVVRPGNELAGVYETTVFVYSEPTRRQRMLSFKRDYSFTVVAKGHVFLELENRDPKEGRRGKEIFHYEVATEQVRKVEFPDASRWEFQHYTGIHLPYGQGDVLHFQYKAFGARLADGVDYQSGAYAFDINTRAIRRIGEHWEDRDDPAHYLRAFDGRYIFFDRPDPRVRSFKLVSSPVDESELKFQGRDKVKVKVLHTFPKVGRLQLATYLLHGLSPCGRYALVLFIEDRPFEVRQRSTYYLVDVSNGNTRVLLKDEVSFKTEGAVSCLRWVGGRTE